MKQSKIKCILTPLLMAKVQYMCALRPGNEWSGNIYYTFEKDEDGETTLTVKDLALMQSYGSEAFTHFSNTDVYATDYIVQHRKTLLGCYMGLLHSHHSMTCGPSGTDNNTMNQEANAPDNNNFLSIIVYNDHNITPYSVRISQHVRHEVLPGDMFSNEFGTEFNEGKSPKVWKSKVETEILTVGNDDVVYSEPAWTDEEKEEFEKRVKELDEKHAEEQKPKVVTAGVGVSYPYRRGDDDEWDTEDYYGYGGSYGGYYAAHTTNTKVTMTTKVTPFKRSYTSNMDGLFPSQIARMLLRLSYTTGPSFYNATEMEKRLKGIEDEFYVIANNMNDYKKVLKTALPPLIAFIASFYKDGIAGHTFKNDFTIAFNRIKDSLWNQTPEVKTICSELIKSTKAIIDAAVKAKKSKSKKK